MIPAGQSGPRRPAWSASLRSALAALAIAAAVVLVYLPALRNGFVSYDDDVYLMDNPLLHGFHLPGLWSAFTEFHAILWIPLTWVSLGLDAALWGPGPFGFHLTNVLLHALDAALAFLVGRALLLRRPDWLPAQGGQRAAGLAAAAAALLWALHPLRVESVAWIVERKDVLSGCFALLATGAWLRYARRREEGGPAAAPYALALALFVAAVLSKPMVVTWPAVLLLLDGLLGRLGDRAGWRRAILEKLPFLAASLASAALTAAAQRPVIRSLEALPAAARLVSVAYAVEQYLLSTLWPARLAPFYPHRMAAVLSSPRHLAAVPVVLALAGLVAWQARRRPWLAAAAAYSGVTLLPASGLVQVAAQSHADRFTYLPSLGFALVAGALVAHLAAAAAAPGRARRALGDLGLAAAAALLVAGALLTVRQLDHWRDGVAFWSRAVAVDPDLGIGYWFRARDRAAAGDLAGALEDLDRSGAIAARKGVGLRKVYRLRAEVLARLGREPEASRDLAAAEALDAAAGEPAPHWK
ncbi:hypothetical protein [Anaeromyxobacter paludicola]|uniref:Uncharacterized protein n=1 Tax=Anaeromyxobacter paludicola TaxID=2918171 RepID=A0ABN6N2G8_9BACT|nr:hypothetical protein [Anaeromyxobacter paludicola]BDG07400.1 hypothetical protein AMPC_05130 [Anaeromyxobacter paludicola]